MLKQLGYIRIKTHGMMGASTAGKEEGEKE